MKTLTIKTILMFGLMLCIIPLNAKKNKYITLKPANFKAQMEQTVNPCIIDIRAVADFEAGHIAGAINMNPADLMFIPELKRLSSEDAPLFVYCKLGKSSKPVAELMVLQGFKNVYMLKKGITAWGKKFPIVSE